MTFLFHTRIDWRKFKLAVCFLLTGCHCMCVWGWFVQEKSRKYNGKVHFVILYPKSVPSGCIKMDRPFFFLLKADMFFDHPVERISSFCACVSGNVWGWSRNICQDICDNKGSYSPLSLSNHPFHVHLSICVLCVYV